MPLHLSLPQPTAVAGAEPAVEPDALVAWIEALPLDDRQRAGRAIAEQLTALNAKRIRITLRQDISECFVAKMGGIDATGIRSDLCERDHLVGVRVEARDVTQPGAVDELAAKIIKGGAGVWGETEMAAHPQISVEDARKMTEYILSLGKEKETRPLPLAGTVTPGKEEDGAYLLTATYYDKGAGNLPSIPAAHTVVLRSPFLKADEAN